MNGETRFNCTHDDITPGDLFFPCRLFMKELNFKSAIDKKLSDSQKEKYKALLKHYKNLADYNTLVKNAPLQILLVSTSIYKGWSYVIGGVGITLLCQQYLLTGTKSVYVGG